MRNYTLLSLAVCLFALAGCSPETVNSATRDAERNTAIVTREANRVEKKTRPLVREVKKQADPALKKLDLGARATAALKLNRNLPSTIRVDASETGIRLRGTVRTAEEKALAERVAKDTLPANATLSNELKVE